MFRRRHRPQRQGAWQPKHSSSDEDAEHVGGRWPCHHIKIRGQQHHAPGNAALQSGQNDAGDPSATLIDSGVWHVRERRDVGHLVGHQHVISSCQEVRQTAVYRSSRRHTSKPKENLVELPNLGMFSKQVYLWILPLVHNIQLFLEEKMHKMCCFNIIAKNNVNLSTAAAVCCPSFLKNAL